MVFPGVEGQLVDPAFDEACPCGVQVLAGQDQAGHGLELPDPLPGRVLDRCLLLGDVALHLEVELHVARREPAREVGAQLVGTGARRDGRCGHRVQAVADGAGVPPEDRPAAVVLLPGEAVGRACGGGEVPDDPVGRSEADPAGQPQCQGQQLGRRRRPSRHCRGHRDELPGVGRRGHGVVGHQQVVHRVPARVEPQGDTAHVLGGVGLGHPVRVGEPDGGGELGAGPEAALLQVLRQVAPHPQAGVLHGQHRLGVEGAVHGRRVSGPAVLLLYQHELPGELLEPEELGLLAAAVVPLVLLVSHRHGSPSWSASRDPQRLTPGGVRQN